MSKEIRNQGEFIFTDCLLTGMIKDWENSPEYAKEKEKEPYVEEAFAIVQSGRLKDLELWVSLGKPVNLKGNLGLTLIHKAVELNRTEMVRLLLKAGADPEGDPWWSMTCTELACWRATSEMVKILLGTAKRQEALIYYALRHDKTLRSYDIVKTLLRAGVEFDSDMCLKEAKRLKKRFTYQLLKKYTDLKGG